MTCFIAGTWQLISSSAEVITGARRMTNRIHRLLQPGALQLDERDRRRLLGLQKRVECLVQPLNFLQLWSKKRDSCVQQIVLSAQELLFDVCGFVERFTPQENLPSTVGGGGVLDSEQLEYYLRELEFACASVSMAVSIARAHDAPSGMAANGAISMSNEGVGVSATSSATCGEPGGGVSLSALLRTSRRIQEMFGRSGDLCACPGRLFSLSSSPFEPPSRGGMRGASKKEWAPAMSLATLKVVAALDSRHGRRRYGISVESRLPLSERESQSLEPDVPGEQRQGDGGVLNSSRPLNFPIEVALDACLVTTAQMSLPAAESDRRSLDLGMDALALIWGAPSESSSPALASDELVEMSSEFPDAVLLPEAAADGIPITLRPALRHLRSASPSPRASSPPPPPPAVRKYAFVFDRPRGQAEARFCEAETALSPLDAMYLARLCALDDGHHHQPLAQDECIDAAAAGPPHLSTADEVLVALLQEGNYVDIGCDNAVPGIGVDGAGGHIDASGSNGHVGRGRASVGVCHASASCVDRVPAGCAEGSSSAEHAMRFAGRGEASEAAFAEGSHVSEETWSLRVQEGTLQGLS